MKKTQYLGLIRHLLTFAGGYLVAKGLLDEATMNEIAGAAMTIIGGIWSTLSPEK